MKRWILAAALMLAACGDTIVRSGPESAPANADADTDTSPPSRPRETEAGALTPEPNRFATRVVAFTPGKCAGFGAADMPGIVLGAPQGAGTAQGSLDVVSLGTGGEIVLAFDADIVDGDGPDLLVFENAFHASGDPDPFAEAGEVSVSEDGEAWTTFTCDADGTGCAGQKPVFAARDNDISPLDPAAAGGDAFDLADVGVARARFVRIRDKTNGRCTSQGPNTNGFDLDAIAIVNAEAR